MANLHWFPLYTGDWMTSSSITAMLPEQEAGYLRLLMHAWGDGSKEPSIEDNDAKLASWSRLGARWKKLSPAIRAEFVAQDGRLYNPKLSEVWAEQQSKHEKAVKKAKHAVGVRELKRKSQGSSQGDLLDNPQDDLGPKQSDLELESEGAVERESFQDSSVLPAPAPNSAPALEGARAAVADERRVPGEAPTTSSELTAAQHALDDAYYAKLRGHVAKWRETHPHEYEAYELAERAFQGISPRKTLSDLGQRMLDDAVLERVREGLKLPTRTVWAESKSKAPNGQTSDAGAAA